MPSLHKSRRGLTLLELLVVIGVIALLGALLLPATRTARHSAAQARETSAARQLMTAYHAYAAENRGNLLPGTGAPGARSETGAQITGITGARWPHSLRPYLGNRFRDTLYINEQAAYYDRILATAGADADYTLSLAPSFGMNNRFVGGDGGSLGDRPVTRLEQATSPARLIAFAAARFRMLDPQAGFFRVEAPAFWSAADPTEAIADPSLDNSVGYLAARPGVRITTAFLDGSVRALSGSELRDMRLWSDQARRHDNPSYRPPTR